MRIVCQTERGQDVLGLIEKVFSAAAKKFGLPRRCEVIIAFLTEDEIRQVNSASRGIDEATDVLSFPYLEGIKGKKIRLKDFPPDIDPETGDLMLGEINICLERARRQAEEYGHSFERECAYLALHGLLHLLGYDHSGCGGAAEMRAAEEEVLEGLNITR
ncbi:MAG: rRNA maturation RNase YbeY [Clostridiales bacterium]|jgi:probable rRNA maturation factor|nr:rRNA maturation RNase YbeY [Clostridiales bacterium]